MALRVIQVNINREDYSNVDHLIDQINAIDSWKSYDKEMQRFSVSLLTQQEDVQGILDKLGSFLNFEEHARIFVFPVTATLPVPESKAEEKETPPPPSSEFSREELRSTVLEGTKYDKNYIILVILSTIVATLGLLNNNVAVLIGGMVIAPLLGPNLALALGAVLGDRELIFDGLKALIIGFITCLALSLLIGWLWPFKFDSLELLSKTNVGYDGIILALASGAAAVLSLTTGLSSVLVGVMVSVALLPPICAMGLMAGAKMWYPASGAGLLFAINIVCINLSANLVFLLKGITPLKWAEKQAAKKAFFFLTLFLVALLAILAVAIYWRMR